MKIMYPIACIMILGMFCCRTISQSQESIFNISYDGDPIDTSNFVLVAFNSGFNDSLSVTFNGKIIKEDLFVSDWSTAYTDISLNLYRRKGQVLKVKNINSDLTIPIKLVKGYGIIYLSKSDEKWNILYSNRPIVYE